MSTLNEVSEYFLVMCDECGHVWADRGEVTCPNCGSKDVYEEEDDVRDR